MGPHARGPASASAGCQQMHRVSAAFLSRACSRSFRDSDRRYFARYVHSELPLVVRRELARRRPLRDRIVSQAAPAGAVGRLESGMAEFTPAKIADEKYRDVVFRITDEQRLHEPAERRSPERLADRENGGTGGWSGRQL